MIGAFVLALFLADPPPSRTEAVLDLVAKEYIHEVSRPELETRELRAFLHDLDPYSNYLDANEWGYFEAGIAGSFGGIGVTMSEDATAKLLKVDRLFIGSAAGAAGVRRGDLLLAVDGRDLHGLKLEDVMPLLRGTAGTKIALTILRGDQPLTFKFARATVPMPSVRGARRDDHGVADSMLQDGIGFIRILSFGDDTVAAVQSALAELERRKMRGLVLDLRDNNGGKLLAAVGTADLFLDRGRIVTVVKRGSDDQVHEAKEGVVTRVPIVLLINDRTVSSGEIFAGALVDNQRVTAIGHRTFGKGRIQNKYALPEGQGGIVLTTGTFQRPNGTTFDRHDEGKTAAGAGIAPAIEVNVPDDELEAWRDEMQLLDLPLVLTAEEQQPKVNDRVLARALEVLASLIARDAK